MNWLRVLTEKSWERHLETETGVPQGAVDQVSVAPERIALLFFLGVVAVLFMLFSVAYVIRMELDDWRPMPESALLWFNTLLLFASSVALQWTRNQLKSGTKASLKRGMLIGGALTLAFIVGQLAVWSQMSASGYTLQGNPANSFFYILTGVHGLHLLGGLWVWTRAGLRLWFGARLDDVRLSVELCALYWHFLLLVWLVVFALISYT